MKNNTFEEIWKEIKKAKNILMTLHVKPDGDSLGCCTAMKYVLERNFKKKVKIISPDKIEKPFDELSYSKEVELEKDIAKIDLNDFDLLIAMDCGGKNMMSNEKEFDLKNLFIINIDHHQTNARFGNLNYIDSEKASACNILLGMFRKLGIKFDRELGKRLLVGICTDGGYFTYDMNPEEAMRDAIFLIDNGVNYIEDILKPIKYRMPLKKMRMTGLLLNKLKYNEEEKFGYSIVSYDEVKSLGLSDSEIRGGINDLQYIDEFDFLFSLIEVNNHIKGSFRSKKGVDVSLFAKELGGGGHKPAAAFQLEKMPLKEAEKKVLEVIKKIGVHKISN